MEVKLMQGDCLDRLREIPDGSVDMVLCDPPYGTTDCEWDKRIDVEPLWKEYHRVCKQNAAILLFAQNPFASMLIQSNPKEFRYEWVWRKSNARGHLNAHKMPMKAHELILVFYRRLPVYAPIMRAGEPYKCRGNGGSTTYRKKNAWRGDEGKIYEGRYPVDVVDFSNHYDPSNRRLHPTQKPVDLLEYLIRTYTNEGETVLDNTMGSGSTGVAAVQTGRSFIGIELDEKYFRIASDRIAEAQKTVETQKAVS